MNYKEVAAAVARSPSTIKKWRSRIEELSGHEFTKQKVVTGLNRNFRTGKVIKHVQELYDFSAKEVKQLTQLSLLIPEYGLDRSICEVFGDKQEKIRIAQLAKESDYYSKVNLLERAVNQLNNKISLLNQENYQLSERLKKLESQEYDFLGRPKKKVK
jgi:transposase-like protein